LRKYGELVFRRWIMPGGLSSMIADRISEDERPACAGA
jgi:hypothetical protein